MTILCSIIYAHTVDTTCRAEFVSDCICKLFFFWYKNERDDFRPCEIQGVLSTPLFSHGWNCVLFSQLNLKRRPNKSEETNFGYCYALWFQQSLVDLFLLQTKEIWNSDTQVLFQAVQKTVLNTKLLRSNKRMHLCLLIFSR